MEQRANAKESGRKKFVGAGVHSVVSWMPVPGKLKQAVLWQIVGAYIMSTPVRVSHGMAIASDICTHENHSH